MKKAFTSMLAVLALSSVVPFTAVHAQDSENFKAIIITDVGGVDDKSFNQGSWEGLKAWGEENGKTEGTDYTYLQSNSDSDYITNLNTALQGQFNITFGVGFKLAAAIEQIAKQNPDRYFAVVDAVVDLPNVASLTFKDNEAAFLAGVAAANETKTKKIGFIGGVEGEVIGRFEAGFVAGVKAVNPDIEVTIEYAGAFNDATKGKTIASAMYANGADIVFHAAGGTGTGLFAEVKDLVTADPSREIWAIGVDRDQSAEGIVEIDGKERNLVLTSTLKNTGPAVKDFANLMMKDGFKPGIIQSDLKNGGVGLTEGQLSKETLKLVEDYKAKIISGEIIVPEKPGEELKIGEPKKEESKEESKEASKDETKESSKEDSAESSADATTAEETSAE